LSKRLTTAQSVDRIADLKPERVSETPGQGNHKHRFGQGGPVGLLQGLQLLQAHVQALGQFDLADSLSRTGLPQQLCDLPEL
jgi:hypothetical protein